MTHEIKEINGKLYRMLPNGGWFKYNPPHPKLTNIPNLPGVYCFIQVSTGKRYIGSSKDLRHRISSYIRGARPNKFAVGIPLNDIAFKLLELTETTNKALLLDRELYWIIKLKSYDPNGFNLKSPVNNININNTPDAEVLTKERVIALKAIRTPKTKFIPAIIPKQRAGFADLLLMFKDDRY